MSSKKNGFGKEVPPSRSHVIAWFIQMDFTEKFADEIVIVTGCKKDFNKDHQSATSAPVILEAKPGTIRIERPAL